MLDESAGALSKLLRFMRILNRDTSLYLSMSARFQNTWPEGETSITLRMCYLRRDKSAFETYLLAPPRSNPMPTNAFFAGEGGERMTISPVRRVSSNFLSLLKKYFYLKKKGQKILTIRRTAGK